MGTTPHNKTQLNVYIPEAIDEYVEMVASSVDNFGKSSFAHLAFAYFRQNFTIEEIEKMAERMLVLGERGLRKVA